MEVNRAELDRAISAADELAKSLRGLKKYNISGWSIYSTNGFTKASRRINGKVVSLHIGKSPKSTEQIKNKIDHFEQKQQEETTIEN